MSRINCKVLEMEIQKIWRMPKKDQKEAAIRLKNNVNCFFVDPQLKSYIVNLFELYITEKMPLYEVQELIEKISFYEGR